jgi:hypothetical protein
VQDGLACGGEARARAIYGRSSVSGLRARPMPIRLALARNAATTHPSRMTEFRGEGWMLTSISGRPSPRKLSGTTCDSEVRSSRGYAHESTAGLRT